MFSRREGAIYVQLHAGTTLRVDITQTIFSAGYLPLVAPLSGVPSVDYLKPYYLPIRFVHHTASLVHTSDALFQCARYHSQFSQILQKHY